MIGRKAVVGLSLLCALAFCAFGAASASAATTAGTCSEKAEVKDFSDAHCDKRVSPPGKFGHKLFANGAKQTIAISNVTTGEARSTAVFEGKVAGIAVKVECKKVTGSSAVTNNAGGTLTLGNATTEFSECTVFTPRNAMGEELCKVTEPIVAKTKQTDPMILKKSSTTKTGPTGEVLNFHEENVAGTEMGLKIEPEVAANGLASLTFVDFDATHICPAAVKGTKKVDGFAYATGSLSSTTAEAASGGTLRFTKESTIGGLTFGGNPAIFEAELTLSVGGEAVIVTTKE